MEVYPRALPGVICSFANSYDKAFPAVQGESATKLEQLYPWTKAPLIASAPMLNIAGSELAVAVTKAGGFGFIAGGLQATDLANQLKAAKQQLKNVKTRKGTLPIGVGFINWGADIEKCIDILKKTPPAAVWFFAPDPDTRVDVLTTWTTKIRTEVSPQTTIWVQLGTITEALEYAKAGIPDVIVAQGQDAGGHGLTQNAGLISLVPEMNDALEQAGYDIPIIAAGGIMDGRGLAAAICLGADGCAMGTRFLGSPEAQVYPAYQRELIAATDGGLATLKTTVYDRARGICGWPKEYKGRGLLNRTFFDSLKGVPDAEVKKMYEQEESLARVTHNLEKGTQSGVTLGAGYDREGRLVTYCGTGVGLLKEVMKAREIVETVRKGATDLLLRGNKARL
ncbi:hypothetical protein KEM56_002475 [Ascosphaera pollenicola]|nr:hypothetical protein KEM56_002475 [Ascosphaera pollenicola]